MPSDRQLAMQELLTDMYRMMARADVREATGLLVVIYDPETDKRRYLGPFPKDEVERAVTYAERTQTMLNADGDGPAIVCTVELLFPPEEP